MAILINFSVLLITVINFQIAMAVEAPSMVLNDGNKIPILGLGTYGSIDRGLIPIPKSTNRSRLAQHIDLFDFKLTEEEIEQLLASVTRTLDLLVLKIIAMAVETPTMVLNDGNKIPILGLGTYGSSQDIARMRQTIVWAIENGYRHIDTASLYRNEVEIGKGIADAIGKGLVKREYLFVTTKLWNDKHARDQVVPALRESLNKLGLDYVDLYLIHSPAAQNEDGSPANIDYLETWKGMEDAKKLGLVKSIGVSNFDNKQIDRLVASSDIKPAVNQVEIHPTLTQEDVTSHCKDLGIAVTAYSPFGFLVSRRVTNAPPPRADDPTLVKIAQKYGKNTSQVVLRYLIDRGLIPIPKSTNNDRLKQNIDVFDFQLTPDEIATISKFNKNRSIFD